MSCVDTVMAAAREAGINLLQEEADEIVEVLTERLSKRVENAGEGQELELFALARQIAKQARINAVMQKRNRLLNAKAYAETMRFVKSGGDPADALSAIMVGSYKFMKNGQNSVDARQQGIMTQYAGQLVAALKREKLDTLFKSRELDEKIYAAMFDPDTFEVKSTADADAVKIAKIIQVTQKRLLKRKNRLGAMIGELKNYVVRQSHDPILLRDGARTDVEFQQAKTKWVAYMMKDGVLDAKTFENKPPTKEVDGKPVPYTEEMFLGDIWSNLVKGNHQKVGALRGDDGQIDSLESFTGPANLAKKLSQSRVIHFKTGKSAYDYSKTYSRQSLAESVVNGITHDAQSIGLMEVFGTNPEAMFSRILNDLQNDPNMTGVDKIRRRAGRLNNQFREIDGSTRARGAGLPIAFGADFAGIASGWRMLQNMAKLGMATISSFSDISTKAHFINTRTDRGIFGSYAEAFSDIFRGFGSSEQKELAYLLNVGVESFLGDVHARFGANDSGPGLMAKAHQHYFRLNGMNWWNNSQKVGLARMMSADLARYRGKAFSDIDTRTRLNLERYGISDTEWQVMRSMDMKAVDGRDYMTPSAVETVADSVVEAAALAKVNATRKRPLKKATATMIQKYRDDLSTKISTYLTDSADTAIPTPGAKERAFMNQGTARGTVAGEALRAIGQLKGFPITMVMKGMSGQYHISKQLGGNTRSGMYGLAQMMVGTTMMGYLSLTLKDILKGKEPSEAFSVENGLNVEVLTKAFVQGGGAGIYGDFLFGEYNKYGQTLTQNLLGPTFGSIDDIARIYSNTLEAVQTGDTDPLVKNATRFAVSNTPGLNLFYTKTALDYMFIYGLMEKTNPGYLRRMERRMEQDMKQDFFFEPSQYAQRF